MISYKEHQCNVSGCNEQEYRHHMCQKHYEFYTENPLTAKFIEKVQSLEDGTAGWKLKGKVILQFIVHHMLNLPMPMIKHFPLEHVFLGELYSIRNSKVINSDRIQQVIKDFDIPENENLSDMQRVLNMRDIETSELGPKDNYLLKKNDLPSKWPIFLSVLGLSLLFCFFRWIAGEDFQVCGASLQQIEVEYKRYYLYACALTGFVFLGVLIPSQYNYFVERCYNMTLYKAVKDNADVVNQVKFIKERKARSGSYYATIIGSLLGSSLWVFWKLIGYGFTITWSAVLLWVSIVMTVAPILFSYCEMALFYPVVEALKRKRVAIDLYNADHQGGLKRYHRYLYLVFLYNEGLAVVLMTVYAMLPVSRWWVIVLIILILPRFNHAGWAITGWVRSIIDFYREKHAEQERLEIQGGSAESMNKMDLLKKVYPIEIMPFLLYLAGAILIPYFVNQIPQLMDLLKWVYDK